MADPQPDTDLPRVPPSELASFSVRAMVQRGVRDADARTIADVLVTSDAWGIHSHGTKALRLYLRRGRAGGLNLQGTPQVVSDAPACAVVDAQRAIGMVPSCMAMDLAVRKARDCGIGFVGVKNSNHFGAAGYYAQMALRHGMVGLAMSNTDPNMTIPGGRGRVLGNNPIAYAVPAGRERPILLDVAMSTVAAGKVMTAQFNETTIPTTWMVDAEGRPTDDPGQFAAGALQPMAGHKGYGLALLVEVLSGVLPGAGILGEVKSWVSHDLAEPTHVGHSFIAVDVGRMMGLEAFKARVDDMIVRIRGSALAAGSDRVYLPGEIEWEKQDEATATGIPLPPDVVASLRGLAEDTGLNADELFA